MKNKISISFIFGLLIFISACSYKYYLKKGDSYYQHQQYAFAEQNYTKALEKQPSVIIQRKLADAYMKMDKHKAALDMYAKVVSTNQVIQEDVLNYARLLMIHSRYIEAETVLKDYLKRYGRDLVAEILLSSCKSRKEFVRDTTLYTVKPLQFQYEKGLRNMFNPVKLGDKLFFVADKSGKGNNTYPWTGNSYLDLYFTQKDIDGKWLSPELMNGSVNGSFHEGPFCFTNNGNTMYLTRSRYKRKNALNTNEKDESNLIILVATKQSDSSWVISGEFPYNNESYSVGHPSVSVDNTTMYFISDMPGGFGGTDIYKSTWDGMNWSKPENLGPGVNTKGNEMFPYIHSDNTLFFSSDGLNTMGGLDVFMSWSDGKNWLKPENLNYPLNSTADDFAYYLSADNKTGFVTSNRTGADRINEFVKNDPTFWLNGIARFKNTNKPAENIIVEITNQTNNQVVRMVSDKEGKFRMKLTKESDYHLLCTKLGCFTRTDKISTKNKKYSEDFFADFIVEEIQLFKAVKIDNIFYDLDKWDLRKESLVELDKLAKLLKDNPEVSVEIGSHTDSRAGDKYNLILSDKRAKSVVNYLILKGIESDRLTWKGYGETQLVNECKNNIKCDEEKHQLNRRTEFKVTKINKDKIKVPVTEIPIGQ